MRKHFYIFFMALFIVYSCGQNKATVNPEPQFAGISEVLSKIDSNLLSYEYIIIVPNNACSGCIAMTLQAAPALLQTQKVAIITEVPETRFDIPDGIKRMSLESVKRDMEIYGLTVIKQVDGKSELIYLDPQNIREEYIKITDNPEMFRDINL